MSLHDLIKTDALAVFVNEIDFAEPVVYYKRNGKSRAISAIVIRSNSVMLPESGNDLVTPLLEVHVVNDEDDGISTEELDLGGDEIQVAIRIGNQPERKSIVRILEHDEGMVVLECR